jgi:hypothetical protein
MFQMNMWTFDFNILLGNKSSPNIWQKIRIRVHIDWPRFILLIVTLRWIFLYKITFLFSAFLCGSGSDSFSCLWFQEFWISPILPFFLFFFKYWLIREADYTFQMYNNWENQMSFKLNMQRITSGGTPRVYDIPTLVPTVLAFSILQHWSTTDWNWWV